MHVPVRLRGSRSNRSTAIPRHYRPSYERLWRSTWSTWRHFLLDIRISLLSTVRHAAAAAPGRPKQSSPTIWAVCESFGAASSSRRESVRFYLLFASFFVVVVAVVERASETFPDTDFFSSPTTPLVGDAFNRVCAVLLAGSLLFSGLHPHTLTVVVVRCAVHSSSPNCV